jgi:hypothetical protein
VTDLLLRQAQARRAGAHGDDDYDVIGTDAIAIVRIFIKASHLVARQVSSGQTAQKEGIAAHRSYSHRGGGRERETFHGMKVFPSTQCP